jgi:hypothetical protein
MVCGYRIATLRITNDHGNALLPCRRSGGYCLCYRAGLMSSADANRAWALLVVLVIAIIIVACELAER